MHLSYGGDGLLFFQRVKRVVLRSMKLKLVMGSSIEGAQVIYQSWMVLLHFKFNRVLWFRKPTETEKMDDMKLNGMFIFLVVLFIFFLYDMSADFENEEIQFVLWLTLTLIFLSIRFTAPTKVKLKFTLNPRSDVLWIDQMYPYFKIERIVWNLRLNDCVLSIRVSSLKHFFGVSCQNHCFRLYPY